MQPSLTWFNWKVVLQVIQDVLYKLSRNSSRQDMLIHLHQKAGCTHHLYMIFLQIRQLLLIKSVWYSRQAIGKNKIRNLAKTMSQTAGLTGRKVNHSARKTTVTSLLHSKVEPTQIMQLTGHPNVQSINQYSSASIDEQETMSNILSDISCGNRGVVSNNNVNTCFSPQPSPVKTYTNNYCWAIFRWRYGEY